MEIARGSSILRTGTSCDKNTCQNAEFLQSSSAPLRLGEGGAFGRTETRIWVDVSVSSRISRIAWAPGICSDALALVRQGEFVDPFFFAQKLRAEPQPLFPGNVETSSWPLLLRVELGTSAKQGLL